MGIKTPRKIIWDIKAVDSLKDAFDYIKIDSPSAARRVVKDIRATIKNVALDPEIFEKDRFKFNNSGEYRAFEKHSYRVAYKFTDTEIFVLRIRHASREPLPY